MGERTVLTRGDFLRLSATAGAGLVIGFHLPWLDRAKAAQTANLFTPNAWISIDTGGAVTIVVHRSEFGQKVWTSLPMIVAEELEVDLAQVKVQQADLNRIYGGQTTGGSASVRTSWDKLRTAGATAREMLIAAAVQTWGLPRGECRAENGTIVHAPTKKVLTFGELVTTAATLPVPEEVSLKDPKDFNLIGKSIKSLDGRAKIDGSTIYGYDFTLPGMLTAAVARCPVFGGKAASYDDSAARTVPGVRKVVAISSGVAVVAENTWSALEGRKALKVTWDEGPNASLDSDNITRTLREAADKEGTVIRQDGDAKAALGRGDTKLEAVYEVPFLDHAPMEPMNCTAQVKDGTCEIWAPTQSPSAAWEAAREVTGFSPGAIQVHVIRMGGAFGRRLQGDFARDAVAVAQALDVPVKVIRTREEDIQHGVYRPATTHKLQAALDKKGQPVAWSHRVSGPFDEWEGLITGGADTLPYAIPNIQVDYVMSELPLPFGAWRSVANTQNAFVNECFLDELAAAAKRDPCEFRRELLKDHPRHLGVLDLAAEKAGWGKRLPRGHYQGIAVHYCFRSYAAVVAEISLDKEGNLKIHRITCAIDCGIVINPDGVRSQVEGGVTLGLTAALYGAITLKNGRVEQSNFHNYKLITMGEMPPVETHTVPSGERPTGVGEPPVPPTPPALVNAIYAATGKRIRQLPINREELRGS
ncbi:molybdopterin cofactor-binding domain-containing protein [Candidatus Neomarinimicrobiota bacterium]